jgi:membrane fusion protein, adhesin transport system
MPAADVNLTTDIRTAILAQSPRGGMIITWSVLLLCICAVLWAYFSKVEEITRGAGKVVPSGRIQIVQNLEGGIISEILVNIGDVVKKDQLLIRIDETRFSAPYEESRIQFMVLNAKSFRLLAETTHAPFVLPPEITAEFSEIGKREKELFNSRKRELDTTLSILFEQVSQRKQELTELKAKVRKLSKTYALLKKEIDLIKPLVGEGAVSEVELLRLQRQAIEILGEKEASNLAIPRAQSRIEEFQSKLEETKLVFSNQAKTELNATYAKLEELSATTTALADRLHRTAVLSPVHGIVKQILVNTVGGIIQPGMNLIEIVPLEKTLLIEARIKPSDIAFLTPQQNATVNFTAYDFTIYGGLKGKIEHISADSIDGETGGSFYLVNIRTTKNYLGLKQDPLPIIPGMTVTVDILTGKKRLLTYLLKPILRAKKLALRER